MAGHLFSTNHYDSLRSIYVLPEITQRMLYVTQNNSKYVHVICALAMCNCGQSVTYRGRVKHSSFSKSDQHKAISIGFENVSTPVGRQVIT